MRQQPATERVKPADIEHHWASLQPVMLRWLHAKTGSAELAEEVFQQASLRALQRLDQLRDPQGFKAWFKQIARNLLRDEWKRQARIASLDNIPEVSEAPFRAEDSCACALGLLNTLPLQYAEVLTAVDIQGQAVQQVARRQGITPNSLSVRLYRARQALRLQLLERCGVDSRKTCLQCDCE